MRVSTKGRRERRRGDVMRNNEFRRKTAQFETGGSGVGDGLRGGRAAAISLPFWLNGKEGNIRGGGGVEENDDCDYGRPARQKKHAEKKCLSTPLCEWVLSCPN